MSPTEYDVTNLQQQITFYPLELCIYSVDLTEWPNVLNSISCFGRSWDSKPMAQKCILVAPQPVCELYYDRARTGWLRLRIICLRGISGHDAGDLVSW